MFRIEMQVNRWRSTRPNMRRRKRAVIWSVAFLFTILMFYVTVGFVVASLCVGDHARWRGITRGPQDFGLVGESVSFRSLDGVRLRAWWLPAASPARGSVVIAHGIDHTRQVMLPRAAFLVRAGYNVLALDLRGHGESGGNVVSPGYLEANDVLAATQFVRRRDTRLPVAVLGLSYGAAAAIFAAARSRDINAVIADGGFPTGDVVYRNILGHVMRDAKTAWWLRVGCALADAPGMMRVISWAYYARTGLYLGPHFPSVLSAAARVRVPVLLISGSDDWMVRPADARVLQAGFTGAPAVLVTIPHGKHDTTYRTAPEVYRAAVVDFLHRSERGANGGDRTPASNSLTNR